MPQFNHQLFKESHKEVIHRYRDWFTLESIAMVEDKE